ncbi:K homology domain-containing protein 4 [Candida tropicalis]
MSSNTIIQTLEYSFVLDPKFTNTDIITYYETHNGIWRDYTAESLDATISYKMIDNLHVLHKIVRRINNIQSKLGKSTKNYITIVDPSIANPLISVSIHGNEQFCNDARHQILTNYNQVGHKTLNLTEVEFMSIDEAFTNDMIKLSQRYDVELIINNDKNSFLQQQHKSSNHKDFSLHIVGKKDNITLCETALRILIDSLLNGYTIDCIDMSLSMIPVLGGVDLYNFLQIAKQTKANIYVPELLPNLFNSNIISNNKDLKIWITAKNISELLLAKHILNKLISDKRELITKTITMNKIKLDSIILNNQKDLLNIMFKYGVFIQLPSLGELNNATITVQGCIPESVNDCVNNINGIAANYYSMDAVCPINELALTQLIQLKKTCVVTFNQFGLQVVGRSDEFKPILAQLASNSMAIKLRLEMGNDQRDFITGKKNGKLIKILNQLQNIPKINFTAFNEYNFYIDVEVTNNVPIVVQALELLELEMPSELKFNIPEVFHKSIIGNGGSIIQGIMKKFNVYIKFSSNKTSPNAYSLKRTNNVLIKCPRKNAKNIQLVKYEIDQLVYKCCMNYTTPQPNTTTTIYHSIKFELLKSHYLLLINNNKLGQVNKIESDYQSFINFPASIEDFKNNSKLVIDMKGSESKVKHCAKQLKKILPSNYEFKVESNPGKFEDVFINNKQVFENQVVIPFKILLGIEVTVNEFSNDGDNYHQIILSYFEDDSNKTTNPQNGIESMAVYLRENGFLVTEKGQMEFNPLVDPVVSHSPVKLNQSLFSSTVTGNNNSAPISPVPLKPITNTLQMLSPSKFQYSPNKMQCSPTKKQGGYYSPTKQQYQTIKQYSPVKQPNFANIVF